MEMTAEISTDIGAADKVDAQPGSSDSPAEVG
jgi:hypothetical protein